ncbi:NADH:flavin oxidoreductase [Haladaptatus sp. DYSN1]|uniref:oxidoreductase n=1 Tax=unclassified Haladaptatus TaxID=2622732 RepID=UPI0024049A78|nr:NADH:flavin oxidoreductase [Haladaptatus sp. DYSN1]
MPSIHDPVALGGCDVANRLYRAPLLECAGTGPDSVEILTEKLEPAAASGVGLIFQGATIVQGEGGCAAPGMTRVHDPAFVATLSGLTDAIHDHGGRIFLQLEHGGLRSMETWHAGYRQKHPHLPQLAVSRPPAVLRALDRFGVLAYDARVLSTDEVYDLAADFGVAAGHAVDAGYDGIHLAGANMGIIQQFLSPYYNRREDEFADGFRFLECVYEAIRDHAGDVPLVTKIPAETAAPAFARPRLSFDDGVELARRAADLGFDALAPVEVSTFWDTSIVRGAFPARAWQLDDLQSGYEAAFGGRWRARLVALANRLQARRFSRDAGWNEAFCRAVRGVVDVPVLLEGGVRSRPQIDRLLSTGACDMVGLARPFYAEPRLATRLLRQVDSRVVCESCNNCTVPQVTGAEGVCRTPHVLRRRGELERGGAYDQK